MHTLKTSSQPKVVQELLFISHIEAGTLCLMCFFFHFYSRFYLIAGGVPLIICGITAAVNVNNYGDNSP